MRTMKCIYLLVNSCCTTIWRRLMSVWIDEVGYILDFNVYIMMRLLD